MSSLPTPSTLHAALHAAPIDPLAPQISGAYRDEVIEVRALGRLRPRRSLHMIRTEHFDLTQVGERLHVEHAVAPERIDDDLGGLLADELFGPGWLRGGELFERIFTGIVRTSAVDPLTSWELFYRNSLERIGAQLTHSGTARHGTIAGYAPVYAHAEDLLSHGTVLELGCCFGFLSLRIAAAGRQVIASDVSAGTMRLLDAVSPRLGTQLTTRVADAARFPGPDGCADTVLAIHLLEHLVPAEGDLAVAEAVRLAARRVVIAVPLEAEADETWGHVRTVSLADLTAWGEASGWSYDVHEHHGGWLVIDKR
ncbi:mycofactocin oligosaccharide methyltransferase MftM [Nocardioides sp.]|uniref:mycofactocin oligosaccharide methyltransferase MftM n=1 Tax=Nocardioides sp. TaxID=35761 RepID=UPI003D09B5CF